MPGALTFGAVSSDRVTCGTPATVTAFSAWAWVYPTTLSAGQVWSRRDATMGWRWSMNVTTGLMTVLWGRTGGSMTYTTSSLGLVVNTWAFVGLTVDQSAAAGSLAHFYVGALGTAVAEPTYSVQTDGLLGWNTEVALTLGNSSVSPPVSAFMGRISMGGYLGGTALTMANFETLRKLQSNQLGGTTFTRFYRLGKDGADAIEYTGAGNGTVVGATQSDGPPVGNYWTRRLSSSRTLQGVG